MGRPAHKPTEETRATVKRMAAVGIPQPHIGKVVGISVPTLEKHYRDELDLGATEANVAVAQSLYDQAVGGNVSAAMFWCKTRMGWRETTHVEHSGEIKTMLWGKPVGEND